MPSSPPEYRTVPVYGPFYRLASATQTSKAAREIIQSGELWGRAPRLRPFPAAQAYAGELPPGTSGFEFYAAAPPDRPFGKPHWRPRADGAVWEDDGWAKVKIFISRVTMSIG